MAAKDRECDFQDIYLGVWPAREEKCLMYWWISKW